MASKWFQYSDMCQKVVDGLNSEDIKHIKFLLRTTLSKTELSKIEDGQDLIIALETRDHLSKGNVSFLHELLQKKCGKLAKIVEKYEATLKSPRTYNQDKFDISSMNVVHSFIKTTVTEKVSQTLKEEGAVLIKGTRGAGKSQIAFWCASTFSIENKDSIIWKIDSKSLDSIHISLATLCSSLNLLEDQLISQTNMMQCIQSMFELVLTSLMSGRLKGQTHLIVMDDIFCPKNELISEMLDRFIHARNIIVIGTSNASFPIELTSRYQVELSGMTEEESISLLCIPNEELNSARQLVKNLNYLPLAISLASSYLKTTKVSVTNYLRNLSSFQIQAHQEDTKGQNLQASYDITLKNVENSLSLNARKVLSFIPYLSHTGISVEVLKSFLPNSTKENDVEITKLISALQSYSLASVRISGGNRLVEMHGLSVWAIKNKKSSDEVTADAIFLLKHYCKQMSVDVRLIENMQRNMAFLEHASLLMTDFLNNEQSHIPEVNVYKSYLTLCIGSTYRMYGRTEFSAEEYFENGRTILLRLANIDFSVFHSESDPQTKNVKSDITCDMESFLRGDESIQKQAELVFSSLLRSHSAVTADILENLVLQSHRCSQEKKLIFSKSIPDIDQTGCIPTNFLAELIQAGKIMPLEQLQKIFLVELIILLLYNSCSNKWWMEEGKAIIASSEGRHLSVNNESLLEFQLTYNISCLLDSYYSENCPSFLSVATTLVRRRGVTYYLRNEVVNHTAPILNQIIVYLEQLLEKKSSTYILFGVKIMEPDLDVHHTCTVLELIRECFIKLSFIDEKNQTFYITQALAKSSLLESYLEDVEPWALVPRVHLAVANMCVMIKTPSMARKAKKHFKLAMNCQDQNGDFTRFHLRACKQYVDFCLNQDEEGDLMEAEKLCCFMLTKFENSSQTLFFQTKLKEINQMRVRCFRNNTLRFRVNPGLFRIQRV